MPVTTIIKTVDPSTNRQQRSLSELIVSFFRLPNLPLLIFLDDRPCMAIRNSIGPENRGLFTPTDERSFGDLPWPSHVTEQIRKTSSAYTFDFPFTGMVYVHGDVCCDEPAFVMTLAHELQHFVQYGNKQEIWAWNRVLTNCGNLIGKEGLSWSDIPVEVEARLVAKRIHQEILGTEETERYIERRQQSALLPRDCDDWKFIQGLDVNMPYDSTLNTRLIFQHLCKNQDYRSEIENALMRTLGHPAFDCLVLNELIKSTGVSIP